MEEFLRKEILILKEYSKIELINKGLSYANVFKLLKDNKYYILKIYEDKNVNRQEVINRYIASNQPIPKVIEYGETENIGFYIIMEYIENGTLEEIYETISNEKIFLMAKELGEKQKELSLRYMPAQKDNSFFCKFKEAEFKKLEQTLDLINDYKNELPSIDTLKIKDDIERLIEYFKNDKCFYMHFDLKADNLMVRDELLMIDYENSTLIYLPIALRCEIYHVMNEDEKSKKCKEFIKGFISGFDIEQLEDVNLNKKLAYAYLKSAFVYIVGYLLKNNRVDEARIQIEKINKVYLKTNRIEELLGDILVYKNG